MCQRKITKVLSLEGSVDGWSHFMPLEEGKAVKHKNVPPVRSICCKSVETKNALFEKAFFVETSNLLHFQPVPGAVPEQRTVSEERKPGLQTPFRVQLF